jgi:hypothetical protein
MEAQDSPPARHGPGLRAAPGFLYAAGAGAGAGAGLRSWFDRFLLCFARFCFCRRMPRSLSALI